jgi:hypothetical protein
VKIERAASAAPSITHPRGRSALLVRGSDRLRGRRYQSFRLCGKRSREHADPSGLQAIPGGDVVGAGYGGDSADIGDSAALGAAVAAQDAGQLGGVHSFKYHFQHVNPPSMGDQPGTGTINPGVGNGLVLAQADPMGPRGEGPMMPEGGVGAGVSGLEQEQTLSSVEPEIQSRGFRMQRDSSQRVRRYSGIVAGCRTCPFLKLLPPTGYLKRFLVNEVDGPLSTATRDPESGQVP